MQSPFLNIGMTDLLGRSSDNSSSSSNATESQKNEGFLKSVWHKLTDHPAHGNGESSSNINEPKSETSKKADHEEPKKASGSGT